MAFNMAPGHFATGFHIIDVNASNQVAALLNGIGFSVYLLPATPDMICGGRVLYTDCVSYEWVVQWCQRRNIHIVVLDSPDPRIKR